jgi:c(7)-type cytochrome triheme protein
MHLASSLRSAPGRARAVLLIALALLCCGFLQLRPVGATQEAAPAAGAPAAEEEHGGDILFKVTSKTQKYSVIYSHDDHVEAGIECAECHETLFKKELNGNKFRMADINKGLFCGACHTNTPAPEIKHKAFAPQKNCAKCHDVRIHDSSTIK